MDLSPFHDVSLWVLQTTVGAAIGAGVTLVTEHLKKTQIPVQKSAENVPFLEHCS